MPSPGSRQKPGTTSSSSCYAAARARSRTSLLIKLPSRATACASLPHAQAGTRPASFAIVNAKNRPSRFASTARVRILSVALLRGGSFAASFGRRPYGAAVSARGTAGDRPPAFPGRIPLPRPPAPRPGRQRRARCAGRRRENVTATGRNAARCTGWPLQRQGRTFGAPLARKRRPLTLEPNAGPAGLTARARPEARP
jgi:hypothetical protein